MADLKRLSDGALEQQRLAARRLLAINDARKRFLPFVRYTMPDPEHPDDPNRSRYKITPQAKLLADVIERVERTVAKRLKAGTPGRLLRVCVSIGPQHGKALHVDTPIPTPKGWSRIVDLAPGDKVFDESGHVCRVVARSPIWKNRPVYKVRTDDRHEVVADAEHEWFVRRNKGHEVYKKYTTKQLADRKGLRNPKAPKAGSLKLPEADLSFDPYLLGVWLGDGARKTGYISAVGADRTFIMNKLTARGHDVYDLPCDAERVFGVRGIKTNLENLGLWQQKKFIPAEYLRGSETQRRDLLHGLMDTDGFVDKNTGICEFTSITKELAYGTRELVHSLGYKAVVYEGRATLYGKDCGPKYRVCFAMFGAASLPRKVERTLVYPCRPERYLTFEEAGTADTVCIEVDAPSHMFLCGLGMIPTCNSELISRRFPAWFSGRNPGLHAMFGTYNQDRANEEGDEVRSIIRSPQFKQVFPDYDFRTGAESKAYMVTNKGGKLAFIGVGGSGTGKPADIFVVDDPFRNDQDAQSPVYRDTVWRWFMRVALTRIKKTSAVIVVHTRWSEDDLIGRLCDPEHPEHDPEIAKHWLYINIPAVVTDEKLAQSLGLTLEAPEHKEVIEQFGTRPMAALWADHRDLPDLAQQRRLDPRGFEALFQGQPSPEDGSYFTSDMLAEYDTLPDDLVWYGASDHATSTKQQADETVIGTFGVSANDDIYVHPILVWDRMQADRVVEELLFQFKMRNPQIWWLEDELISKSFGPFLKKRMTETRTYVTLQGVTPHKDLMTRARAIQGRMAMRKVYFPKRASWWHKARQQLLKFPHATHDDFVSFMALIGLGLMREHGASPGRAPEKVIRVGSLEWVKAASRREQATAARQKAIGGY